jgi:hypothetical protein
LSTIELEEDISSFPPPPPPDEHEKVNVKAIPKIAANAILLSLLIIVSPPFNLCYGDYLAP